MLCVKVLFWYMGHNLNYGILATPTRTIVKTRLKCHSRTPANIPSNTEPFRQNKMHPAQRNQRNPMKATPRSPQDRQVHPGTGAPDTDAPQRATPHQNNLYFIIYIHQLQNDQSVKTLILCLCL